MTATDILPNATILLKRHIENECGHVVAQIADIWSVPFADASRDVVACAGGLS